MILEFRYFLKTFLLYDRRYAGGLVINILFAGVMAGFSLGQAVPNLQVSYDCLVPSFFIRSLIILFLLSKQFIEAGKVACASLYEIIDRKPIIDASSPGNILPKVR